VITVISAQLCDIKDKYENDHLQNRTEWSLPDGTDNEKDKQRTEQNRIKNNVNDKGQHVNKASFPLPLSIIV
jgi:hypothetical protein